MSGAAAAPPPPSESPLLSALHAAIEADDTALVRSLVAQDASLLASSYGDGFDRRLALCRAAELGRLAALRQLVALGADVNQLDAFGSNALWWACDK